MSRTDDTTPRQRKSIGIGQQFGRWTIIAKGEKTNHGQQTFVCRCSCGVEKTVYKRYLLGGQSTSCGCMRNEMTVKRCTKHGHSRRGERTTEYNSWVSMIVRCYDPDGQDWKNYGGRGITVCEEWREDFARFLADMGPKPSPKHQIDRIDNNKGYSPENCHWTSPRQNVLNRRCTVYLEHDGKRLTQKEWSEITGLSQATLCERRATGWTDTEVLTIPAQPGRKHRRGTS